MASSPGARSPGLLVDLEQPQHDDAVVVVAEAELAGRADHAVGDVAVGLARRDREPAGQHRAGQRDDDEVADGEVVRAADDPLGVPSVSLWPCSPTSTWHQRIGLAVLLRLLHRARAPGRRPAGR